jgi:peptidoglycan/LPS O-acetylase OafA/YrhL
MTNQNQNRITSLDAIRGLAAVVVLFCHLQHAFLPGFYHDVEGGHGGKWSMVLPTFLLNGGMAVAIFFVLSGFVLTDRFLKSGWITGIPDAVIKRWPRLAGPVLIVSLISGFLMGFGLYCNLKVAGLNGSWWLTQAYNWKPSGVYDVIAAIRSGAWDVFFTQNVPYNGAFWTMHFELLGSIMVYFLAAVSIPMMKRFHWTLVSVGMLVFWLREAVRFPFMGCFVAGVILAILHTKIPCLAWRNRSTLVAAMFGCVIIGGFTTSENDLPVGIFKILGKDSTEGRICVHYFLYTLIALIFLSAALWSLGPRNFLSHPYLRRLGHLSFPIYLIHTPVICSLGSWIYLTLHPHGVEVAATFAILASIIVTFTLSIPLAAFDDRWLLIIRKITPFKSLWELCAGKANSLGQKANFWNN